ncbi:MAG: glycosyltransferase 87 family protein [Planctomycetota bacterium]|nr:glycosyltransferase 87 family protein [Planctomycetota bacterium]
MTKRVGLILLLLVAVLAYGWFDVRRRARIDRGTRFHRTDFTVYQYAARALADGKDPYEARNPRGYKYVYPPLLSVLLMPVASWDPANAAFLYFLISMAALIASLWLLHGMPFGGKEGSTLGWRAVLIAGVLCVGFAHQGFQRGQVTHLLLFTQVAALAVCVRRHYLGAGLLLALGATLRLTPLLAAGAVGLGLLAGIRRLGWKPLAQYSGGFVCGLFACLWLIPVLALGTARANEVNARWLEVTHDVYVVQPDPRQLLDDYKINEFKFKNQAPRRVFASWGGKLGGVEFENSLPNLPERGWKAVNVLSRFVGLAVLITIAMLAWVRMNNPGVSQFVATFALAVFAPVLVTRYTWPTHFLMALPLLGVVAWLALRGEQPARRALIYFFAGTLLFYAAHWKPIQIVGGAGPLLIASVMVVVMATKALFRRPA